MIHHELPTQQPSNRHRGAAVGHPLLLKHAPESDNTPPGPFKK